MSDRDTLVSSLAVAECKMRLPRTQEDCCGIIARITLTVRGEPKSEAELLGLALGNAQGLFGEAWDAASEHQRLEWIDMCERALRAAMNS
jgi:hypothetical protein